MAKKKGETNKAQKKGKTNKLQKKTMPGVKAMKDESGGGGGMSFSVSIASLDPELKRALETLFNSYSELLAHKCVCFGAAGPLRRCAYDE